MQADEIELRFILASDEPRPNGDLWAVDQDLRARGVQFQTRVFIQDDAERAMTHLGEWAVKLGPIAVPAIAAVATAWLQARLGRKARIKFGDVEVEARARTPEEVERLVKLIPQDRAGPPNAGAPKAGGEP